MRIHNLNNYISKNFSSVNLPREIGLYEKYSGLSKVEEAIKKAINDFSFTCYRADRGRVYNVEIFLGLTPTGSPRDKDRALEYVVADNYLKDLLERKVIKKFFIEMKPAKCTKNSGFIKARVSLIPKEVINVY